MWKKVLSIAGAVTVLAGIAFGGVWAQDKAHKVEKRLHASDSVAVKSNEFFGKYNADEVLENSVKEYILDSIEEHNTREWRAEKDLNDSIQAAQINEMLKLLRLAVRQNQDTQKILEGND